MFVTTVYEKETMNLKDSKEGCGGGFRGRKGNDIIMHTYEYRDINMLSMVPLAFNLSTREATTYQSLKV